MVALAKIFATALAVGTAVAAPVGAVSDSPTLVTIEARPNHNPSTAIITRGFNNKNVVLMMGFTQIPANVAQQLSAAGYEQLRQSIQGKFMTWIGAQTQNTALQNVWNGLVQGLNGGFIQSAAQNVNDVVQFQLAIELGQASNEIITSYIVGPLAAYLQNAGVNVVQQSGAISRRDAAELVARAIAPTCSAADVDMIQYLDNNPPAPFGGDMVLWCH